MKRNRQAGHNWERVCVKLMQALYTTSSKFNNVKVETSRYVSKKLDDAKVDLAGTPLFNIQCKRVKNASICFKVLDEMPKDKNINVVFLDKTSRKDKIITSDGKFAVLKLEDFLKITKKALKHM